MTHKEIKTTLVSNASHFSRYFNEHQFDIISGKFIKQCTNTFTCVEDLMNSFIAFLVSKQFIF
jgi:hypothetical protein